MSFSANFLAHFSDEEKQSEIVKIYSVQGDNVDMAISQEMEKRAQQVTELLKFPESLLRSWLAAFLIQVEGATAPTGNVLVTCTLETAYPVILPKDAQLSANGITYTQISSSVQVAPGAGALIQVRQGEPLTADGTYSEFIKVPATGLDYSDMVLTIAGKQIQPASSSSGDVDPHNGYFAFVYGGNLYIKIYPGEDTPYPEGKLYTLSAWNTIGKEGNVPSNTFNGYTDTMYDTHGLPAHLTFTNDAIANGKNSPTKADLVNKLRAHFFINDAVVTIEQYRIWFLNQPSISDVLVEGDYEKYLKNPEGDLSVTGMVYVSALDQDGNPINEGSALANQLRNEVMKINDLSYVYFSDPVAVPCYIEVVYQSSNNNVEFENLIVNTLSLYFTPAWLKEQGLSAFEALDFDKVRQTIGFDYGQVGLEFHPCHAEIFNITAGTTDWLSPSESWKSGEGDNATYYLFAPGVDLVAGKPYAILKQMTDLATTEDDGQLLFSIRKRNIVVTQYDDRPEIVGYCVGQREETGQISIHIDLQEIGTSIFAVDTTMVVATEIAEAGTLPPGVAGGYLTLSSFRAGYSISQVLGA